jgi:hypothetical protein
LSVAIWQKLNETIGEFRVGKNHKKAT